ncbi:MAG: alanine racemase [Helicobacter sp.]|nr:alanine racemase [Helicobacter sp.]
MAYIALYKKHFFHNLNLIAQKLPKNCELALVLKDNAYGHGLREIGLMASSFGINSVFVKNYFEAKKISDLFKNIFIFYPSDFDPTCNNCIPVAQSLGFLKELQEGTKICLKINLLMNRNGIAQNELQNALKIIKDKGLLLSFVIGHSGFAGFDRAKFEIEKELFKNIRDEILSSGFEVKFSLFNSSGVSWTEGSLYDLVRVGHRAYGYSIDPLDYANNPPLPVLELFAHKITEHSVNNESVGYGGVGRANGIISSYDLGYGDGLYRIIEPGFKVTDGEEIIPVMSMDCMSIASRKNELSIFKDARVWAARTNQSVYDVLVKLSPFIPRKIIDE